MPIPIKKPAISEISPNQEEKMPRNHDKKIRKTPESNLLSHMKSLSIKAWQVTWMDSVEYSLWEILTKTESEEGMNNPKNREMGKVIFTTEEIEKLRRLKDEANGWWYTNKNSSNTYPYMDTPFFIPLKEWESALKESEAWTQFQENGDSIREIQNKLLAD